MTKRMGNDENSYANIGHMRVIGLILACFNRYNYRGANPVSLLAGGGIIGQLLTKFAISRVWGMIFQLSKNPLKSKRMLSNFKFHVPRQC